MTAFARVDYSPQPPPAVKRPSRWSLSNWSVRWKVFAIILLPMVLAVTFGGLRINLGVHQVLDSRRAAHRAELVPTIVGYMSALENAMVTATEGGDAQGALAQFDARRADLGRQVAATDVVPDVRLATTTLLDYGQDLINKVMSNAIDLRARVLTYAPLLLTAETAITGSVRDDDAGVQLQGEALSRAVGARGQMAMQQMLVDRGGDLPEPELRSSMNTLAGTEPSTVSGMSELLGGASNEAQTLRSEMVKRLSLLSDPAVSLVGNPELSASQQATRRIANDLIDQTTRSIPATVQRQAHTYCVAATRDIAVVASALVVALLVVLLVARSLVRPLRRLRDSALQVAHHDLARELDQVRAGGDPTPVAPIPVHTSEEVGQVAHAVDELHEQAVLLAGEQARLQLQVSDMFETLSRRSRSLVDQQLLLIDRLERDEQDPQRLDNLFRLDHLAARMRRNGANLLVLADAKPPREHADPETVSAIVNAAASEVEDYTRIAIAAVPDGEVVGPVADDVVHLLAELLDNGLRYSPPTSQVRVWAAHSTDGGLIIEVSDDGLGMTEPDQRVANSRLSSGGEVDPYTARHMGLFVVGRLASQHGLVVRLRSTVAGEPNSGTTAGVYVPPQLLVGAGTSDRLAGRQYQPTDQAGVGVDVGATTGPAARARDEEDRWVDDRPNSMVAGLLPRRDPGASGVADVPAGLTPRPPGADPMVPSGDRWRDEDEWPAEPMAAPGAQAAPWTRPSPVNGVAAGPPVTNGVPAPPPVTNGVPAPPPPVPEPEPSPTAGAEDAIYQKMLSEWLVDPHELADSADLNWDSVWDHGWSAASAVADVPVAQHTDEGLPIRDPGARLVPGAADAGTDRPRNGVHRNGGAHRHRDEPGHVASSAPSGPARDPDAVRASIGSHFGGVHAGRSHAQQGRGTDDA